MRITVRRLQNRNRVGLSHLLRLAVLAAWLLPLLMACTPASSTTPAPAAVPSAAPTLTRPAATLTVPATPILVQPSATPTLAQPSATPTLAVTSTPAAKPAPPISGYDFFDQQVAAKQWTEGQGLLTMLRYLTGRTTKTAVFGTQTMQTMEANGVIARARAFLKASPKAAEAAEIQTLLDALLPDESRMLQYAAAATSYENNIRLAAYQPEAALLQDAACDQLWGDGFPAPKSGSQPPVCVLYKSLSVTGSEVRIYYPKNAAGSAASPQTLAWAADALKTAGETYQKLGGGAMPKTTVVFSRLADKDEPLSYAAEMMRGATCQIGVYPLASKFGADQFKQALAHEFFHCYQDTNMKTAASAPYSIAKWWLEGSATYFSNVVYPKANQEFEYIAALDYYSPNKDLFSLDYENCFFFQFLANKLGDKAVLNLLTNLPASGAVAAYQAALQSLIPDFASVFQEYGQAYLDRTLMDSGGGAVPFNPSVGKQVQMGTGTQPFASNPFILTRYYVLFPKGRYTLSHTESGAGLHGMKPQGQAGAWAPVPDQIQAACGPRYYNLLMTTAQPAGAVYKLTVESDQQPSKNCDSCLFGSWKLIPASFDAYMRAVMKSPTEITGTSADETLIFTAEGISRSNIAKLSTQATLHMGDINKVDMGLKLDIQEQGSATAEFATDKGFIEYTNPVPNITAKVLLNGQDMGTSMIDKSMMDSLDVFKSRSSYVCSEDSLSLTPEMQNLVVPPLLFTRIKK